MPGFKSLPLIVIIALTILYSKVNAGPMKRLSRMVREVYPEIEPETDGAQPHACIVGDVVYGIDEPVPAEQPCLKCRCQPPGVQCETIQCTKKPGCKAVHRPNKCCPDYQCECENNGKIYANGERLEAQPGGECKVCYCRGGEVQCAEVSCYIRNDCEGKRVPGTCCPKYDNCPPIDAVHERPTFTPEFTSFGADQQPIDLWSVTPAPLNLTDPILIQPSNDIQDENQVPDTNDDQATPSSNPHLYDGIVSKITIQEIIPERKEIPITTPPKSKEPQGTLIIEEATRDPETSNELLSTGSDSETDSSEISEVFQHPPPVLRIGDKLLFLKKGEFIPEKDTSTPASVITIIGAEGLQRGFEESGEIHEVKLESSTPLDIFENKTDGVFSEANDLELKTSESSHILSLVKKRNKPSTTTTPIPVEITTVKASTYVTEKEPPVTIQSTPLILEQKDLSTEKSVVVTQDSTNDITTTPKSTPVTVIKNTEPATEQNPAYPPIPDIMAPEIGESTQQHEAMYENATVDSKILPQVLDVRNNGSLPINATHSEWLKSTQNESLVNYDAKLPEDLLKQKSPIDSDDVIDILNTTEKNNLPNDNITIITTEEKSSADKEAFKSLESMEASEESRENVTPQKNHASVISNENASIESIIKQASEVNDMSESEKELLNESSMENIELTTKSILQDVEIIDNVPITSEKSTTTKPMSKDVELIHIEPKIKPTIVSQKTEATTYEHLPKPQELTLLVRPLIKREVPSYDSDDVFKDLDKELGSDGTDRVVSKDEDQNESEMIFKELLEETTSPKPRRDSSKPRNKDEETLERVSNAIAQFALRGRSPDSNILGLISNFFSSQSRDRQ